MPLPLRGPVKKQRASASSAAAASPAISDESKAKCAVGRSPQALEILSSMWMDPLVGLLMSSRFCALTGATLVSPPVLGGGGSEPQPPRDASDNATPIASPHVVD